MHELGPVLTTHPVDNDRRKAIGGWGVVIGVLGVVIAVALSDNDDTSTAGQAFGGAVGLALSALWLGGWHLARAALSPDERFTVHQKGIVHSTSRREVIVPWDAVVHATVRFGQVRSPIAHYFGSQLWVRLTVRGTRRGLRFNGLAEGYDRLLEAVVQHCAPAPGRTAAQRWAWAGVGLAAIGCGLGLVAFIVSDPELPEIGHFAVAVGLVISFVVGVAGIVLAARRN